MRVRLLSKTLCLVRESTNYRSFFEAQNHFTLKQKERKMHVEQVVFLIV
jgi:hypothetical protein